MSDSLSGIADFVIVDDVNRVAIPVICGRSVKDTRERVLKLVDLYHEVTGERLYGFKSWKALVKEAKGLCISEPGLRWTDQGGTEGVGSAASRKRPKAYLTAVIVIREPEFLTAEVVAHEVFHAIKSLYPARFHRMCHGKQRTARRTAEEFLAKAQGELTLRIFEEATKIYAA